MIVVKTNVERIQALFYMTLSANLIHAPTKAATTSYNIYEIATIFSYSSHCSHCAPGQLDQQICAVSFTVYA